MKNSAPEAMLTQRSVAPVSALPASALSASALSASAPHASAPHPSAPHASASFAPAPSSASSDAAPRRAGTKKGAPDAPGDTSPTTSRKSSELKKRVRLKPETREQLLERLRNPPLSLHETSILLRVSRATVRRYADAGRLPCLRTPGGQRRFALRDIETFYRQLKVKR